MLGRSLPEPDRAARLRRLRHRRHPRRRGRDREDRSRRRRRLRRCAGSRNVGAASCCRSSSTSTPISTRATSGGGSATRVGDFPSALAATIEDRSANWTAADVAARMEFSLRSRLRLRDDGAPHPHRQPRPADAHQLAGSRRGARALARQDRRFRRRRSSASSLPSTARTWPTSKRCSTPTGPASSARPPAWSPDLREGLEVAVRARRAQGLGARLPRRRKRRSRGALAQDRRRHGDRAPLPAPHPGRPLLLARAAGGRRAAKDDRRRRARRA